MKHRTKLFRVTDLKCELCPVPCAFTERALSQLLLVARRGNNVKRFGEGRFWSGGIVKCAKVPNNKFQISNKSQWPKFQIQNLSLSFETGDPLAGWGVRWTNIGTTHMYFASHFNYMSPLPSRDSLAVRHPGQVTQSWTRAGIQKEFDYFEL